MHVPLHLVCVAVLAGLAVDGGGDALVSEVPVRHKTGADGAQGVAALNPQHGARIGVTEIVEAVVVCHAVTGDVVARFVRRDVAAGPAHDDGDLAFVVQPLTALWSNDVGTVAAERGDRLLEVGGSRRQLGHELVDTADVVQVDADDLCRLGWSKVDRAVHIDVSTVAGDESFTVPGHLGRVSIKQNSSSFGHRWPPFLHARGTTVPGRRSPVQPQYSSLPNNPCNGGRMRRLSVALTSLNRGGGIDAPIQQLPAAERLGQGHGDRR